MTAPEPVLRLHGALLAVAPAGLAVNVACQLVMGRLSLAIGPVRRQFICFGLGFAATVAGLLRLLGGGATGPVDFAGYVGLYLLSYVLLGFCFFNLINLNVSSLRIRILKEHLRRDPAPLPEAALLAVYNVGEMLDVRLMRLRDGGQIAYADGRYYFRPGGVAVLARIFSSLRRLLLPE